MLNFINGIIRLPFLELSIFIFMDIKMRTWSWSNNCKLSIEPQSHCTNLKADLALYWWQSLITSGSSRIRVKLSVSQASNCGLKPCQGNDNVSSNDTSTGWYQEADSRLIHIRCKLSLEKKLTNCIIRKFIIQMHSN